MKEQLNLTNYRLEGETLDIFKYPSAVLKKVSRPVTEFDEDLMTLVKNMLYTMYHAPGIGLAAPQVGRSLRLFTLDIDYKSETVAAADGREEKVFTNLTPQVFINPVVKSSTGEIPYEEGCLSLPGIYEKVKRADKIELKYQDLSGKTLSLVAEDLLSVCIQHENDHLDGILFLERISLMKRKLLQKKILKNKALNQ